MVLNELIEKVNAKSVEAWKTYVDHLRDTVDFTIDATTLNVPYLLKEIAKYGNEDTIVTTDVGQHQMWAAQYYPFEKPNRLLTSGGLGTMGYGLGAALGAQFANEDESVIMITGDGSFRMNFNEILTAVKHKLPIKIFVMNNGTLGMVRQMQNLFYEDRFSATELDNDIDYVAFAKSLGGEGFNIKSLDQVDDTLKQVFACKKLVVCNCIVDLSSNVYPMVLPGTSIFEAVIE